jgi:hypothetical protein
MSSIYWKNYYKKLGTQEQINFVNFVINLYYDIIIDKMIERG